MNTECLNSIRTVLETDAQCNVNLTKQMPINFIIFKTSLESVTSWEYFYNIMLRLII